MPSHPIDPRPPRTPNPLQLPNLFPQFELLVALARIEIRRPKKVVLGPTPGTIYPEICREIGYKGYRQAIYYRLTQLRNLGLVSKVPSSYGFLVTPKGWDTLSLYYYHLGKVCK